MPLSYRNLSIDLQGKSIEWFLYARDLGVKGLKDDFSKFLENLTIDLQGKSIEWFLYARDLGVKGLKDDFSKFLENLLFKTLCDRVLDRFENAEICFFAKKCFLAVLKFADNSQETSLESVFNTGDSSNF